METNDIKKKLNCVLNDLIGLGEVNVVLEKLEWVFGSGKVYYVNNIDELIRLLNDYNGENPNVDWHLLYNIYDETIGKGNAPYFVMSEEDGLISINDYIKKLD